MEKTRTLMCITNLGSKLSYTCQIHPMPNDSVPFPLGQISQADYSNRFPTSSLTSELCIHNTLVLVNFRKKCRSGCATPTFEASNGNFGWFIQLSLA